MRIAHIKISNILGIDELEFTASGFNEITGGNGVDKTSIIDAIKSVVQGGHDATLLHAGAPKGEIVLMLDNGTELRKTIKPTGSETTVKRGDTPMRSPMETIRALTDVLSVNPIEFLTAKQKERVEIFLKAMPIELDAARVKAMTGHDLPKMRDASQGLEALDIVRQLVFDARTGVNRRLEDKNGTIKELQQAMPDVPEGLDGNQDELEATLRSHDADCFARLQELEDKVSQFTRQKDRSLADIEEEARGQIAEIEDEARRKIKAIQDAANAELADLNATAADVMQRATERRASIKAEVAEVKRPVETQLAIIKANRNAIAKREQTVKIIEQMQAEVGTFKAESDAYTQSLAQVDAYKVELLAALPIPNLVVTNNEIYLGEIPFNRLNTAQKISIAFAIAKLRAKDLNFVCVDNLEALDPDSYDEFQRQAAESKLQLFVTRVTSGPLKISHPDKSGRVKAPF